jgi:putative ATP-binding cassette transporter
VGVISIELALVALDVPLNQWNNRFYNALQDKIGTFSREIGFFVFWQHPTSFSIYQLYLNQWLQIRWRRWMTTAISAVASGRQPHACSCRRCRRQSGPAHHRRRQVVGRRTLDIGVGPLSSVTLGVLSSSRGASPRRLH